MSRSRVAIAKGGSVEAMVERVVDLLGGIGSIVRLGSTVVVKPNAGHVGAPGSSVNTTPEVVAAVIRLVRKAQPAEIILAESAAIGCDTLECLEVSGIRQAAEEAGVDEIRDIKRDEDLVRVPIENPTSSIKHVDLPRFLLEADLLVDVPVFKTHVSMVFSCALKNLKGVVQDRVHYVMHTTNLAGAMMDLGELLQEKTFAIADLYRPMEGFGPHSGNPVEFGCILAGKDLVAVDATACRMVGLPIEKAEYFVAAEEKGLGHYREEDIDVLGEPVADVFTQLYLPYLDGFGAFPEYTFCVRNACSTCQGLTAFTMSKLKSLGEYEKNAGVAMVLGRHKEVPAGIEGAEAVVLMGDCTKTMKKKLADAGVEAFHVPGCPPTEPALCWSVVDRRDVDLDTDDPEVAKQIRKRVEYEDVMFKEWLRKQSRA
ncbi:MAG: DUF362 domain-containing protein [Thermoleophilia bacterium]|nr:DUF362 domain-containing protein [Thermoleophilia bacterium]